MSIELKVPDIGDFKDVDVSEVLVKPGDTVAVEQSLITIESDKASMEIPSSHAAVIKELRVKVGDKVSKGAVIAIAEENQASAGGSNRCASSNNFFARGERFVRGAGRESACAAGRTPVGARVQRHG